MGQNCKLVCGQRYRDWSADGRVVVAVCEGGNGAWCRFEDGGGSFHCCVEDFYLWRRFEPLDRSLVLGVA